MKRPNGAGNIVKLPGKRRKPYAIRITETIGIDENGKVRQKLKYIGYYEKQTEALTALDKYNTSPVEFAPEKPTAKKKTFTDVYNMWLKDLERNPEPLSKSTMDGYRAAYKKFEPIHDMVFENITVEDMEDCATTYQNMSKTSIKNMRILVKNLYKVALKHDLTNKDLSKLVTFYYTNENERPHVPFTDQEIALLWHHKSEYFARLLLILIYTGMRIRELLEMKTENVHLKERYMIGGKKTEAGKNRVIPISEKIAPFFDTTGEYLIMYEGKPLLYEHARNLLKDYLPTLKMDHQFHDTRHTTATMMEREKISRYHRKLILGHQTEDVTDGYTHPLIQALIDDINKI